MSLIITSGYGVTGERLVYIDVNTKVIKRKFKLLTTQKKFSVKVIKRKFKLKTSKLVFKKRINTLKWSTKTTKLKWKGQICH